MSVELSATLETNLERHTPMCPESEALSPKVTGGSESTLNQAVIDHFRCPQALLDFGINAPLSKDAGYFRFGTNTICYGRSNSGPSGPNPNSRLHDAIDDLTSSNGTLNLPFDPTEVIDNLRLEYYAKGWNPENNLKHSLRRMYYLLRPLTNLAMRKQVQKFHARKWKERSFPKWPVDTTVEDVCETLLLKAMEAKGVGKVPFVWFWPDGAPGCVTMTHDVETEDGRNHCAELMSVDDSFGIKAAFGIVPEERYEVSVSLLDSMRSRGFEIVIQDLNHDGRLFDNRTEFLRRVKMINRYGREYGARGFRAAVLYRKPQWYDALEFAFDMSIPNVAHLDPQHGGCCTVTPYFIGDVLELPVTTTQDYVLFHVLGETSIDLWKAQIDLILRKNGLMTFIVHPDYVIEQDKLSVYRGLLSYLRQLREDTSIWFALPSEINSWWRARSKMWVTKDGNSWRVQGDSTNRAVLAYAQKRDGKLVYELAHAPTVQRTSEMPSVRRD